MFVVSAAWLAAAWWFGAHLMPWTLDDLKPFSQQMCSIYISIICS
uniref:Frizzled/Smoothened transmembrane domain-containing protein n=1 Tax=Anguilla anguilla TaxID=7936 RepID=A0A0E9W1Z4_ANGAN